MAREPTDAEISAEIARINRLREERNAAAAKTAAEEPPRPDFNRLRPSDFDRQSFPPLTEQQVGEMVASWRASYAQYDDPELVRLLEEKLVAALAADGIAVPPRSADDRLRELKARHARRLG